MASKEATVVCLDVGRNMWKSKPGRLEQARTAVNLFLQQKVMDGRKTEHIALVLFGSNRTANDLATEGGGYENIEVYRGLDTATLEMIRFVDSDIEPGKASTDFLDALVVAMDLIANHTEGKKFFRRIILVTDAGAPSSDDLLDRIIDQLNSKEITLQVFGIDFDDSESRVRDPAKPEAKARNEATIARMAERVKGMQVIPMADALERLSYFRGRNVRQTPLYRGALDLGGADGLQVAVHVYTKTAEARAPTFKRTLADEDNNVQNVQRDFSYKKTDELGTEVDREVLVKAYKYGKSLIPFARVDEEQLAVHYEKCLSIIGFCPSSQVPPHLLLGNTLAVEAEPGNAQAFVALSALIRALHELDRVAIARYVRLNSKNGPKLCVLTPHVRVGYECLYMTSLPFAEDIRQYGFASLSKCAPSEAQLAAADAFIESLDLSTAARDADGDPMEDLKPSNVPNVHIHHLQEIIKFRALNPTLPLPPMNPTLKRLLEPNAELVAAAADARAAMEAAFELRKSDAAEKRGAIRAWQAVGVADVESESPAEREAKRPRVDMSLRSLADGAVSEVGTADPVGDFAKMVARRDLDLVVPAVEQLSRVIMDIVTRSFGPQGYERALECLQAMRAACIVESEAARFNAFLVQMRTAFKGQTRDDFWQRVRTRAISLISADEAPDSDVAPEDARAFLQDEAPASIKIEAGAEKEGKEDAEDLLAEME